MLISTTCSRFPVEVLFHKMVQDQTAEESLRRICEARKWPEPEFTCKWSGKDGFLYSCTLKTKSFIPTKPASNEDLAKELAALECLEWLGFQQRSSLAKPSLRETYFTQRNGHKIRLTQSGNKYVSLILKKRTIFKLLQIPSWLKVRITVQAYIYYTATQILSNLWKSNLRNDKKFKIIQ